MNLQGTNKHVTDNCVYFDIQRLIINEGCGCSHWFFSLSNKISGWTDIAPIATRSRNALFHFPCWKFRVILHPICVNGLQYYFCWCGTMPSNVPNLSCRKNEQNSTCFPHEPTELFWFDIQTIETLLIWHTNHRKRKRTTGDLTLLVQWLQIWSTSLGSALARARPRPRSRTKDTRLTSIQSMLRQLCFGGSRRRRDASSPGAWHAPLGEGEA